MHALNDIIKKLTAVETASGTRVFFAGIGGIGMSALARYFRANGAQVSGYDKTETDLCRELVREGIRIVYEDDVMLIDKDAALVVYTPAIPADHAGLAYYRAHDYPVFKRSDVLGAVTGNTFTIAVAGTHGKTTTSSMIAHILRHSEYGCNAFLGGISANYQTNFWSSTRAVSVVEADEYDRSFLKLNPDIAVITSMDPDHLDIYGSAEQVEQAFIDFSKKVKAGGMLVTRYGLRRGNELQSGTTIRYDLKSVHAGYHCTSIRQQEGGHVFNVTASESGWQLGEIRLSMGGLHNVENMLAAICVAHTLEIPDEKIKEAIRAYRGVRRRFEYVLAPGEHPSGIVCVDDYAHHPQELRALIAGARELFPDKKCTVVFQPHLFSRTRDFATGFAEALDEADEVVLLPIYPAREKPVEGVDSNLIGKQLNRKKFLLEDKSALTGWVAQHDVELLLLAGAGDIDTLVKDVRNTLLNKKGKQQ